LTKIFVKRDSIRATAKEWFPHISKPIEVLAGHSVPCHASSDRCKVRVLSPPSFEGKTSHPLDETVATIRFISRQKKFEHLLRGILKLMIEEASAKPALRRLIGDSVIRSTDLAGLPDEVIAIFRGEDTNSYRNAAETLRRLLAVADCATQRTRFDLDSRTSRLPERVRRVLLEWPSEIRDATHLFNVSLLFRNEDTQFLLLTGDAHPVLWPCILSELEKEGVSKVDAIQVPHHGSEKNVDLGVLSLLKPSRFVVSADAHKLEWRHPSFALGAAIEWVSDLGDGAKLYCTNRHRFADLCQPRQCALKKKSLTCVEITSGGVEWDFGVGPQPAHHCPNCPIQKRRLCHCQASKFLPASQWRVHRTPEERSERSVHRPSVTNTSVISMEFRIADTFTDSLVKLTAQNQKAVKTAAFDLQVNPTNPGMRFHKLDKPRDPNFWSICVNDDIRIVVHRTTESLLLCYAGHHDEA